jgi:rubrerythrin
MPIERKIICDVCHAELVEGTHQSGFPGWGHVAGVALNGVENPTLCPVCLSKVMDFVDRELVK